MNPLKPVRGLVGLVAAVPELVRAILTIPKLAEQLDEVVRNTAGMRENTQEIAIHVPHLVILEQSLPAMVPILEDMNGNLDDLTELAEPLRRFGRWNNRVPHRNGR